MHPIPIAWDFTVPHPSRLQTGDLLFPRRGALPPLPQDAPAAIMGAAGARILKDFLGPHVTHQDGQRLLAPASAWSLPPEDGPPKPAAGPARAAADGFDPDDPAQLHLMLRILNVTFPDLTERWLHMSVDEFVRHPLFQLLLGAMRHDLGGGFFVGHSAMVLRETAGEHADDGRLFVIEANITDFSRYRVSIHPYHAPGDPVPATVADAERMSGWVNYRTALGQKVWAARPLALAASPSAAAAGAARQRVLSCAKQLLGRPYGFFDSPTMGDTDRLYCSEFVHAVLAQASDAGVNLRVDDCQSWAWLLDNLEPTGLRTQLVADLRKTGLYDRVIAEPFFLLTVQMLWRSAGLQRFQPPWGEGAYG